MKRAKKCTDKIAAFLIYDLGFTIILDLKNLKRIVCLYFFINRKSPIVNRQSKIPNRKSLLSIILIL